jgi:phasin family protein
MAINKVGTGRPRSKAAPSAVAPVSGAGNEPATTVIDSASAASDYIQNTVREEHNMDSITRTSDEVTTFSQGNIDAMVKSGQAWAAGMQAITQTIAETAQAQLDHTLSTWRALSGAKSLKEAIDLQTSLARASFETALAETGKLTEVSIKLAEQSIAPLTARMSVAVEKLTNQGH